MGIRDYPTMYGVDECRCCGAKIQAKGPEEREAFVKLLRSGKAMPEAQWRAMGLLAPPTKRQLAQPATGCCYHCGIILMRQKLQPLRRLSYVIVIGFVAFAAIRFVGTYLLY